ncbi:CopD family protein [Pseudothioclava nitratireducens]|uniref:CopD family protein n=1 Tax=Pseudothioclava nitratireducens TaxID=1928646 RepID=UPI0023DA3319|nr:CopD family protein [Defluviimonas nitratireducens]MDF1619972.1 CopD family protein [Defluviimonas nitratireducens]
MTDLLADFYPWIKSMHVMSILAWMAGLFYLPRLYVYHVEGLKKQGVVRGSDMDLLFQHQERLLMKAIMNPAMISSWLFGLMLVFTPGIVDWSSIWPWTKAAGVIGMTWFHMWCGAKRKQFVEDSNALTGRQYRMMNEVPTVFMIVIVLSVIVKF